MTVKVFEARLKRHDAFARIPEGRCWHIVDERFAWKAVCGLPVDMHSETRHPPGEDPICTGCLGERR